VAKLEFFRSSTVRALYHDELMFLRGGAAFSFCVAFAADFLLAGFLLPYSGFFCSFGVRPAFPFPFTE